MGKNRGLFFKKSRDTKETFHAKLGTIKDRNGMDLTEAKDIKKSWHIECTLSQHHLLGFEVAQLKFHHLH